MFKIPEWRMEELAAAFAKMAKKAAKLSVEAPTYTVTGEEMVEGDGGVHRKFFTVELSGEAPKLAGWTLIGELNHTSEGNLVKLAPGLEVDSKFREAPPWCEHCKTSRRRNDTFLVRNEALEVKQVGRNCLGDFLGTERPEGIAAALEMLITASLLLGSMEEGGMGGGGRSYLMVNEFLSIVGKLIKMDGWMSRSKANPPFTAPATADQATTVAFDSKSAGYFREAWEAHAEKHHGTVAAANEKVTAEVEASLTWIRELDMTTANDYLWNLQTALRGEFLDDRAYGIAASLLPAFYRVQEREAMVKRFAADTANSTYFGTEKKRETFTLTLVGKVLMQDNGFGASTLFRLVDESGNLAVWFSGSYPRISLPVRFGETPGTYEYVESIPKKAEVTADGYKWLEPTMDHPLNHRREYVAGSYGTVELDLVVGHTYRVKGTVKRHEEYRGTKQTTLSRCSFVADVTPEEIPEDASVLVG